VGQGRLYDGKDLHNIVFTSLLISSQELYRSYFKDVDNPSLYVASNWSAVTPVGIATIPVNFSLYPVNMTAVLGNTFLVWLHQSAVNDRHVSACSYILIDVTTIEYKAETCCRKIVNRRRISTPQTEDSSTISCLFS
jgi:hypothetical protein